VRIQEQSSINLRAIEKLSRDLGPTIVSALEDPKTIEVLLNADGGIWQEKLGEKIKCIGTMLPQRAAAVIQVVAGYHGKTVTRLTPLIEGELPLDGSRFAGQLPPVVQAPTFAIRKKAIAIFTLDQYLTAGIMTTEQCSAIKQAVCDHRNILVIGGTGSGKTPWLMPLFIKWCRMIRRNRFVLSKIPVKFNVRHRIVCNITPHWKSP